MNTSVLSTPSSNPNLVPFEGLALEEPSFIGAIISRVNPTATTFVPVFKAYQDEFEECGRSASGDQFYYNLLVKLGTIRAENRDEKWRMPSPQGCHVCSSLPGGDYNLPTAVEHAICVFRLRPPSHLLLASVSGYQRTLQDPVFQPVQSDNPFHEECQQLSPLAQSRTVHPVLLLPRAVSLDWILREGDRCLVDHQT